MKKLLSFLLCITLIMAIIPFETLNLNVDAATVWSTIPSDNYVYDTMTYNGITTNALFPKSSTMYSGKYDSDSTYSCASLPVRFFKNYGISIRIPGSGAPSVLDGSGDFIQVTKPQIGDVLRKPGVHWAIVKSVNGNTITVFEQNYWWNNNGTWKAGKNRTISQTDIDNGTWILYRCTSFNSSSSEGATNNVIVKNDTSKNTITNTNAILWGRVDKPSSYSVTKIGIRVRKDGSTYDNGWSKYEAPSKNYVGSIYMQPYYDMNSELNTTLTHATKYYYQIYALVNGKEYWSSETSFTTTGSHSYGSWTTTAAATCTAAGSQTRKCSCGKTETKTLTALGHDYSSVFTVDKKATCGAEGSKSRHCSRCSAKTDITAIPALTVHSLEGFITTKEPTCTNNGSFKTTCNACNKTFTGDEPALGHDFSAAWTTDKIATCTSEGSKSHHCTRCDAKSDITAIKSLSHQWDEWKTTKEPTTTSAGEKQRVCKRDSCDEKEIQVIAKLAQDGHTHKYNDWVIIKPATCTDNGTQEHTCTVCGEKENQSISKLEHTFGEWIVETAATEEENGSEKRVCSDCKVEEIRAIFELIEDTDGQTKEDILEQNKPQDTIEPDDTTSTNSIVDTASNNTKEKNNNNKMFLMLLISFAALFIISSTILLIVSIKRKNK